jgi:hypothetical protein
MINNFEDLKYAYHLLNDSTLESIIEFSNSCLDRRPRKIVEYLKENNNDFSIICFCVEYSIKKVRKKLLETPYDDIKNFNECLKECEGYRDYRFIKNFHNKEYWISSFLDILSKKSRDVLGKIQSKIGWDEFKERSRIDFDDRVLNEYSYISYRYSHDPLDMNLYSSKYRCRCKKEIGYFFKLNKFYDFRTRLDSDDEYSVYVNEYLYLTFEENSFSDYFITRDDVLNIILN